MVIQYLYTFKNSHHDKSNYYLLQYKITTILLTIFTLLLLLLSRFSRVRLCATP